MIGILRGGRGTTKNPSAENAFRIMQIIDEKSMLVYSPSDGTYTNEINSGLFRPGEKRFMVIGVNTFGQVDDSAIVLEGIYEVLDPQQYVTVIGGSNTVPLVRPFALQFSSAAEEKALLEKFKKADAAARRKGK